MTTVEGHAARSAIAVASPVRVDRGAIRVLLVEPETTYRETLIDELARRGIAVRCVDDEVSLLGKTDAAVDADVILAGWGMPKMSGLALWARLRRHGVGVPLVLLAGQARQAGECLAFNPDKGKFVSKARGVETLARHLKVLAEGFRA